MHGIKQEHFYKTSEEEEKFKDRLKKGYILLDSFLDFIANAELSDSSATNTTEDNRMFELSWAIIEFMHEFVPSWNYRKRYILKHTLSQDVDSAVSLLSDELDKTASILKSSPKSYEVWHHRLWTITSLLNLNATKLIEVLLQEFLLCIKFFKYDGRNFHCWSHLKFITQYLRQFSSISHGEIDVDELSLNEYRKLIDTNLSNYSAWYQRSNLSHLFDSPSEDLELLKQAIYTDPQDQCIWTYYNWFLFARNSLNNYLLCALFNNDEPSFTLYFNRQIRLIDDETSIYSLSEDGYKKISGTWSFVNGQPLMNECFLPSDIPHYVWKFDFHTQPTNEVKMELVIASFDDISDSFYSHLQANPNFNKCANFVLDCRIKPFKLIYHFTDVKNGMLNINLETLEIMEKNESNDWEDAVNLYQKPVYLKSGEIASIGKSVDDDILSDQLEMVETLISVDSESKYTLLTKLKLLQYLGHSVEYEIFNKLSALDKTRSEYYDEMLSRYNIKNLLKNAVIDQSGCVNLSNISISRLNYATVTPYFCIKSLDLSFNNISDRSLVDCALIYLTSLEYLNLSGNKLKSLKVLKLLGNLSSLRRLDISNNPIDDTDFHMISEARISEIDITYTPLAHNILDKIANCQMDVHISNFTVCCYHMTDKSCDVVVPKSDILLDKDYSNYVVLLKL